MKVYKLANGQWTGDSLETTQGQGWPSAYILTEVAPQAVGDVWCGDVWRRAAEEDYARAAEAQRLAAIPASISPRQFRQALTRAGYRNVVETAIAAGSQDLKDWYEFADEFLRDHPLVQELLGALGLTEKDADDVWTLAGSL